MVLPGGRNGGQVVSAARALGTAASMIPNVSIVVAKCFMVSLSHVIPGADPKVMIARILKVIQPQRALMARGAG